MGPAGQIGKDRKGQKIEIEAIETPQIFSAVMKVPGEYIQLDRKGSWRVYPTGNETGSEEKGPAVC